MYPTSPKNRSRSRRRFSPNFIKRLSSWLVLSTALTLGAARSAQADDYTWDADATLPFGGTGSWDTSSALWWDGASYVNWSNLFSDRAIFTGTAGTVSLDAGGVNAGGLIFNASGYTIDQNTLTLGGAATVQVTYLGNRATISSVIDGTAGLTKIGNGALVLTSANTFTGDVVIKAGSLIISNQNQLGAGTGVIGVFGVPNTGNPGFTGGALVLAGTTGSGPITLTREISLTGRGPGAANVSGGLISVGYNTIAGGLTAGSAAGEGRATASHGITTVTGGINLGTGGALGLQGNGNWIFSGQVTGSEVANDRFFKTQGIIGTTLWLQNANNSFNASIRIDAGTVRVSTNSALGRNLGTQSLDLNGGRLEVRSDAPDFNTRNVNIRGNTSQIFVDRAIGGSGLNQNFVFGNLNNSAANGGLTMEGRNGSNLSITGPMSVTLGTNVISWINGGTLAFTNSSNGLFTIDASINRLDETTARILTLAATGEMLLTGNILQTNTGAVSLSKTGTGTLTIGGALSTATGTTTISSGTLSISNVLAIPSGALLIGNATTTVGALTYTGPTATLANPITINTTTANAIINASGTGALTINGPITNGVGAGGAHTLIFGGSSTADNTITSVITAGVSGITSLQKVNAGTWVLNPTANNTFTGSVTISGGILKIQEAAGNFDVLPDAGAIIANVDTLTQTAGGTLNYLGASGAASTELVGALTPTAGALTVNAAGTGGGTAALTFASLGTVTGGTGVNLTTGAGGSIVLTGVAPSTATTLPGTGHIYFNGADFARVATLNAPIVAPVYDTDAGFVIAGAALTATSHNLVSANTSTGTLTISSLKISGSQTVAQTGLLTISTGGILQTGGLGIISGTGINSGAADLVIRVDGSSDTLTISAPITAASTGGLTKNGAGTLVLNAINANTGAVNINEGTVKLLGATTTIGASNLTLNIRQGATFDLNGVSVGTVASGTNAVNTFNGAGTVTNSGAAATFRIGNNNGSGYFSGLITGNLGLVKAGTTTIHLSGLNTYTGPTTLLGGNLDVTRLANIGQDSGIGRGDATDDASNAASLVFNGGALRYIGSFTSGVAEATQTPSVSIDRLFTLAGNGDIRSYGSYANVVAARAQNNASLVFSNTGAVAFSGVGARTLTLGGDSTGDNRINLRLINNPNANETLSITKADGGLWILGNATNSYTGTTSITGGALRAQDGTSLPTASNLLLSNGVFESTGTFNRGLGTGSGQFRFGSNAAGGFSAGDSKLTVDWTGLGTPTWGSTANFLGAGILVLNSTTSLADVEVIGNFSLGVVGVAATPTISTTSASTAITITTGNTNGLTIGQLITGANIPAGSFITSITGSTTFNISQNATATATLVAATINAGGWREFQVNDNTSTNLDYATVSGVISGTAGLGKSGTPALILGNANTYTGNTVIRNESLVVTSIGAAGATATSVGTNVGGGIIELGNPGNTNTANLNYVGPGETTTRQIYLTGTTGTRRIDSSGSGALILTNLINSSAASVVTTNGNRTLELRGTNTDFNTVTSSLADDGGSLRILKSDGGTWVLNGTTSSYTGGVRVDAGNLGIGSTGTPLGATGQSTGFTSAAVANVVTVVLTSGSTGGLTVGMNVNGTGIGYGDTIASILNDTTFTLSTARTIPVGAQLVFGGLLMSNAGIFASDGPLTLTQPVIFNNNTVAVFAGTNAITLNGDLFKNSGANDHTISNNLEGGALLTVNGNFYNFQNANATRLLNIRGTGSTVWNGDIKNNALDVTSLTGVNIALAPDASFTFGGGSANTYTGATTLTEGTLILNKTLGVAQIGNGAAGTTFFFSGGVLQSSAGALTGANKLTNNVFLNGNPATFSGANNIEIGGSLTNNNGSRILVNNLGTLTLSGGVNLSQDTNTRTLFLQGSGATVINSVITPGSGGTSASNLTYQGTGSLTISAAATATGILTANRGTITLKGAAGTWALGTVQVNPAATLTLDNSIASGGNANRLGDALGFAGNGGTLNLITNGTATTEAVGALTLTNVQTKITVSGGGTSALSFTGVTFSNTGSSLDLSTIPNLGTTNTVTLTGITLTNSINTRVFVNGGADFATATAGSISALAAGSYNTTNNLNTALATDTMNLTANAATTGNRTVNAIKINGSGLTISGAVSNRLTLGAAGIINTGGNNTLNVTEVAMAANIGVVQVAPTTTLTVNSGFTGSGGFVKALGGALTFGTGARSFVTSTHNLLDGTVNLSGGADTLFPNFGQLTLNTGATLNLNGGGQYVGVLASPGVLPNTGGTINGGGAIVTNGGGTFGGVIESATSLGRVQGGTLAFENAQTYTGVTLLMGGTTSLENDATLLSTSEINLNNATLFLGNNSSLQTQNSNRVGDSIPLYLRGGTISVTGRIDTAASEAFGALNALQGANTITATASVTTGLIGSQDLTFASLSRTAGAGVVMNFTGTNLGQVGNSARIFFTSPLTTVAGGALGGWAIANTTDFAAYNTVQGVGVVGTGGFAGYDSAFGAGNITELPGAYNSITTTQLPGGTTTTALLKFAGNNFNNLTFASGSSVLDLQQGGLLRSNNSFGTSIGTTAVRGVLTAGGSDPTARELFIFNNGSTNPTFANAVTTSGSPIVTGISTVGLQPGMSITNANFPAGTTVLSIQNSGQATLSANATATTTAQTLTAGALDVGSTTSGSPIITLTSTVGVSPGMTLTGTGIPANSYVVSVDSATQLTLSQSATATAAGTITFTAGLSNVIINSVIADNPVTNAVVTLVKSAAGVLTLTAPNTYSGGTIINGGTLNLASPGLTGFFGFASNVVLPAGGLTLNNATVTMLTNQGQIEATNAVTLRGGSVLTLTGNNTLASLAFDNNGGTATPTVTSGGILTLTGATPITVTSSNPSTIATIAGSINVGSGAKTINTPAIQVGGVTVTKIVPTLSITAAILSPGASLTKTGDGLLSLSGQSTFAGGVTLSAGDLAIGGSSTQAGGTIVSGPLGTGSLSVASGSKLFSTIGSVSINNPVSFAGPLLFDSTANSIWTLTLNGRITGIPNGTPTINVANPGLTVALLGNIPNIASITSFIKTGLGALIFNSTGYTGDFNASLLGNSASVSLLNDGNGTSTPQNIVLGNVIFDTGIIPAVTVGRAGGFGGSSPFNISTNKIMQPASLSNIGNGITVTNNSGDGLGITFAVALAGTPTINVVNATGSNVTQGLYLDGVLSGTGFIKTGAGTVVLSNTGNTFTGNINIQTGVVSISDPAQLGNSANLILLNPSTGTSTLRATDNITTTRTIQFTTASNLRAIEVSDGKTLQLNTAFDVSGATAAALTKSDAGTLALNANNSTWTGVLTISQGAVSLLNAGGLGTTAGNTVVSATGAALQIPASISTAEPLSLTGSGISSAGALQATGAGAVSSGAITLTGATFIGADSGATLSITGGITGTQALTFSGAGNITLSTTVLGTAAGALAKIGTGNTTLAVGSTGVTGTLAVNRGTFTLNGTGQLGGTGAITINPTGTITLDNTSTNVLSRLGGRAITLVGANLNLIGNTGATTTETLAAPTFGRGLNTITVTAQPGQQTNLVFNAASVGQANAQNSGTAPTGTTVFFRGTNLGQAAGAGIATISNTTTGFIFNGSTATSGTTKAIMPWAIAEASVIGTGSNAQFATADTATSVVRLLNTSTEMQTNGTFTANVNQLLTANVNVTTSVQPNSITLESGGQVTISSLITLNLASGGILAKAGNNGIGGGAISQTNTLSPLTIWTVGDLTISSVLNGGNGTTSGTIGFVKAGAGILTLSSPLSTIAGLTAISANTFSGQTVINQGTIKLNGGKNTLQANNFIDITGGSLDLNGTSQQVYTLFNNNSAVSGAGGTVINSAGTTAHLIVNQDNTGRNWAGSITGNVKFTRSGLSTLTMYSPQTYTGSTLLNGGSTTLRDDGSLANTSSITINYATLTADSATSTVNSNDRINDAAPITLNGGILQVLGRAATNTTETLGSITLASGHSALITNIGGTGINSVDVTAASLARSGDTATVRFNSTGTIGSFSRLFFTAAPTLTNNIIGAWAIVDREYASYNTTYGISGLNQTGFAGYSTVNLLASPTASDNVRFSTPGLTTLAANTTVNTLTFGQQTAATTLDLGGYTLTLAGGGLLLGQGTDNVNFAIINGNITSGVLNSPSDFFLTHANFGGTNRTVNIDANIVNNGTGAVRLIKTSGDTSVSWMTLNGTNTYTGGTVVNGGTLNIGAGSNIPLAANAATGLIIRGGNVTTNAPGAIAAGNVITLEGSSTLNYYGDNTVAGLVFNNNGGAAAPTVMTYSNLPTAGAAGSTGVLTIGASGIVATSSAVGQTSTATGVTNTSNGFPGVAFGNPAIGFTSAIDGRVDFGPTLNTVNVSTIDANGVTDVAPLAAGFNLRGIVGSAGGFQKTGDGVLGIAAQSVFTGPLNVVAGGLRTSAVNGGSRYSALTLGSGTRLDLNGLAASWGSLAGSGTVFNSSQTAATLTVGFDNTDTIFSGQFVRFNDAVLNAVGLNKIGNGTLSLTGVQTSASGSTGTLTVNGGTLAFNSTGAWFSSISTQAVTFTVNTGGILALDNSGTNVNNRLGINAAGTLNLQGGKLSITGNSGAATTNQITTFNVTNGGGRLELTADPTKTQTLTITNLNTGNSTGSWVIGGITGAASAVGVPNLIITTANLTGTQGGTANGTSTMSIRSDALADASVSGLGTGFLVKDSVTNNYRALGTSSAGAAVAAEFNFVPTTWAGTQNAGLSSAQNLAINTSANTITISGTASLGSSLNASAFGVFNTAGTILTQALSNATALLVLNGGAGTFNVGGLAATTVGTTPYIHVVGTGTLDVNSYFGIGGTAGLVKADDGTLSLNRAAYYTGGNTTVNGGTLVLNSGADNTLAVVPGATTPTLTPLNLNGTTSVVDLKGYSQAVGVLTSINPMPGQGGSVINSGATPATFTTSTQSASATFAGQIGGGTIGSPVNANIALTKAGGNTLTLTNASTYTGATIIRGGTLQLRDAGSIVNTSSITVNYSTLNNDNFGLNAAATPPTRISATTPITLLGGNLTLTAAGSVDNLLTVNTLTIAGGGNTIYANTRINEGSTAKIVIGNLIRSTTNHNTISFPAFTQNNSSGGASGNASQGLSANGSVILNQINGATPVSYVTFATTTVGSTTVSVPSTVGFTVGQQINSANIPVGTTIASIVNGTTLTLNTAVGIVAGTNVQTSVNSGLVNNILGGWAVTDGSSFATYVTGYGITSLGQTIQGIVTPAYTSTAALIGLTPVATGNYSDSSSGTQTFTTGVKSLNSLRLTPGAALTYTPVAGTQLQFGTGIVTNANQTITFGAADATNTISGTGADLYVFVNQGTTIINMAITGNAAFVSSGGATLRLAPQFASNSYLGGTYVNAGTLQLQAFPGFIAIPGDLTINNATVTTAVPTASIGAQQLATTTNLYINGGGSYTLPNFTTGPTQTIASINFDNQGGSANPTFAFGTPTTLTSTVILTAANAITANNESLATTPLISTGAATLTALQLSNANPVITTTGSSVNSLDIQVAITSAGGEITKSGLGSLNLRGANTFTTGFNLSQGSLILGVSSTGAVTNGPIGTGTLRIQNGTSILSSGNFSIANAVSVQGDFTFGGVTATNNVTLSGAINFGAAGRTLTVTSPAVTATISGAITSTAAGATALTKAGAGTLLLSNAGNNFNGKGIAITGGILRNGVVGAIPAATAFSISAGAGLDLNNLDQTIDSLSGAGFVTQSGATTKTLTISSTVNSATFSGVLADNTPAAGASILALTKAGAGTTQTLTGPNTYAGVTNVTGGILSIGNNTGLGATTAGTTVASGASLELQGNITVGAEALSINGTGSATSGALRNLSGNNIYGGTVTLAGAATIQSDADLLTLSAATSVTATAQNLTVTGAGDTTVSGAITTTAGNLTKLGGGLLTLSGANTYTGGTAINAGTLRVNSAGALGTTGTISFGGGTLQYTANNTTDYTARFSTAASQAYRIDTNSQTVTYSSTALSSVGGTLTKLGAGSLNLTLANTYSGGTTVSGGTLRGGDNGSFGAGAISLAGGTLAASGTRTFSNDVVAAVGGGTVDTSTGDIVLSGSLSGSTTLVKTGGGKLDLTNPGANTYNGIATVQAGNLAVNTDLGAATVNVQNGGTLSGEGTVGAVTVQSGGIVSPGNSPGILNTGAFNLQLGAHLDLELGSTTPGGPNGHDQIIATPLAAGVTLTGDLRISLFTGWSDTIGATYNIVLNSSAFATAGTFSNDVGGQITSLDGNHVFGVNYGIDLDNIGGSNDVQLTLLAVPEPNSLSMLAGSLGLALGLQRFRRRRSS